MQLCQSGIVQTDKQSNRASYPITHSLMCLCAVYSMGGVVDSSSDCVSADP